jgi:ribosomal protein S18 acetylase RimI-like enzyme
MTELFMVLPSLGDLRGCPIPEGFGLRPFLPGDGTTWLEIQESTGVYSPIPQDLFEREFGSDHGALVERQLFVTDGEGSAVGTGTAWFPEPKRRQSLGRIHWIAVCPEHQRKRIGSGLVTVLCGRLLELGYEGAYLTTGSVNHPAIELYRSLGFSLSRPMGLL